MTRLLEQTYASQKTYGDKAQMMEFRDQMFQMVLGEFTFEEVRAAFIEHVKRKPELPTPSDIYNLIDPPAQPLSPAVYLALKKRAEDGEYIYGQDRDFMRAFERQEIAKAKSE